MRLRELLTSLDTSTRSLIGPMNQKRDGKWRALEVKVMREDLTVRRAKDIERQSH